MDELIPLSDEGLKTLSDSMITPNYDRTKITPGIVHIGLGNFHRAHQSWYLHRLFNKGLNHDWGIVGAGVRSFDAKQRKKLLNQDYLSTLIELNPVQTSAEIVGSMTDYVEVSDGNRPLIECMCNPAIRIVSLTVTESGYYIDPVTTKFDSNHPDIRYDSSNFNHPCTAFGAILAALKIRRDQDIGPFTLQSCDNLRGNGDILRQTVVSLANISDPKLGKWIDTNCSFPNSMVDCIVPATGPKEIALSKQFGIRDNVPVTHENFRQWVIEDKFCAGRPDWEKVGVTFSEKVGNYEDMKIRILNGGHQIVANAGEILSIETISGCMQNPMINSFFQKVQKEEIAPHIRPVTGMNPSEYIQLVAKRFSNQAIVDTTRRVSFDGSSRHPGFLLPIVRDGIEKNISIQGLALVEAVWARMCAGVREDGSIIKPNDPIWTRLTRIAAKARERPLTWLEFQKVYGDLGKNKSFSDAFSEWLNMIWRNGLHLTLKSYVEKI